jgi:two-component system nitrogen regulation response regulator GlnG
MPKVLVVDDDRSVLHVVGKSLSLLDVDVVTAGRAVDAFRLIGEERPDVVLLDVILPDGSGLDVFRKIRDVDRRLPVIYITAADDSETAIDAMQLGAFDYLSKPLDLPALNELVARAIETRRKMYVPVAIPTGDANKGNGEGDEFLGRGHRMMDVFKAIGRVAGQNVNVLIRGESGTGKELVARSIYQHSERARECFMAVNCAAIPDNLLESELFGHEKGSFTGADQRRIGKFEQCDGGTILLDEVGDMSPLVQGKVLRLLQQQQFERVGGNETISTDVRIIAATNRNLEDMVEKGTFRADLFYRLNGVTILLPPLREREEDVPLLLEYFLSKLAHEMERLDVEGISPDALELLQKYKWPGNVREMQSVVRQALLNTTGTVITSDCLPDIVRGETPRAAAARDGGGLPSSDLAAFIDERLRTGSSNLYAETQEMVERYLMTRVLRETAGNQTKAAEILGITRGKVRDRVSSFKISLDKNVTLDANGDT